MSSSYLPAADADFSAWARNFTARVAKHWEDWGLTQDEFETLVQKQWAWDAAFSAHAAAQAAAASARQAKDDAHREYETAIRSLVRRLQASTAVTDTQRQGMGITVRDHSPTPAGPPATRPVATLDTSQRLRHVIHFRDEGSPTSKARPAGVMGCEIWVKIGAEPADPSELSFLALDTSTPYTVDYPGSEAGENAHYVLRWVSTRGEKGPWSATVSATVGA